MIKGHAIRLLLLALTLVLPGCGARQDAASVSGSAASGGSRAAAASASASKEIVELTDQTLIYECPKCGMMFSAAGTCTMDGDSLVATRVGYSCPADGQPVAHAGQCPRCAMHARVEKTALNATPASGGVPSSQ